MEKAVPQLPEASPETFRLILSKTRGITFKQPPKFEQMQHLNETEIATTVCSVLGSADVQAFDRLVDGEVLNPLSESVYYITSFLKGYYISDSYTQEQRRTVRDQLKAEYPTLYQRHYEDVNRLKGNTMAGAISAISVLSALFHSQHLSHSDELDACFSTAFDTMNPVIETTETRIVRRGYRTFNSEEHREIAEQVDTQLLRVLEIITSQTNQE